jgi:hypothetical protein
VILIEGRTSPIREDFGDEGHLRRKVKPANVLASLSRERRVGRRQLSLHLWSKFGARTLV